MKALVVVAHPVAASFTHALADAAVSGLRAAGHEVTVSDLYSLGFRAAMAADERVAYHTAQPVLDPLVAAQIELVTAAQILVFVYPTWWSGLPAILKGWLDRVMVENVGFRFNRRGKVRPALTNVRRVVGISTYGSPRLYVKAVNDNGRRILTRCLRLSTGLRTRRTWLALYGIDMSTDGQRGEFLERVRTALAAL